MDGLEVGFAKADITPRDKPLTLYHRRGRRSDGTPIRDSLCARATAFKSGTDVFVLVTLDTLCADGRLRAAIAPALSKRGIPPERVALCATHTHTGPTVVPFHGIEPTPPEYLTFLARTIVDLVLAATHTAQPARVAFGKSTLDLNVNRRQIGRMSHINTVGAPSGLTDPAVTVARVETADRRAGLLFNYAAHPITMSKNPPLISADYPGAAARYLELDGATHHAQFLQGTCGNLNMKIHGDAAERDLMGKALANAALDASRTAKPCDSAIVRVAAETVRIPWQKIPTLAEARACLEKERAAMAAKRGSFARPLDWAEDLVRTLEDGPVAPHIGVLVQAARIGHAAFVTLPGEVFVEIGLAIKQRAGIEHLFVVAYANNCEIGYVPTAAAFAEGGYEVDSAPRYYGLFTLSPQCESIMVEAGVRVLGQVMRGT